MDAAFLSSLLTTQVPALPDMHLMRAARHLSWGMVLVFLALLAGRRWPRWLRWGLAASLFGWTLLPGAGSLALWLGLAFQMPSLSSTLLSLGGTVLILRTGSARLPDPARRRALWQLGLAGIVLGWLLLLDTFALLPFSLYEFGFSPLLVLIVGLLALLPWMGAGVRHPAAIVTLLLGAVLLLYVLLHLPNGNLWNALLDPWLWIALQLAGLWQLVRRLSGRAPTRA
jgi:hypothetical protein